VPLMAGAADAAREVAEKFSKRDIISLLTVLGAVGALAVVGGWFAGATNHKLSAFQSFMESGPRFTAEDGAELIARVAALEKSDDRQNKAIAALPPEWLREQISDIKAANEAIRIEMKITNKEVEKLRLEISRISKSSQRIHYSPNDWMKPGKVTGK
jgi:hypothetical protein